MQADVLTIHWNKLILGLAGRLRHPDAAVNLQHMQRSIELHYHTLGGVPANKIYVDASAGDSTAITRTTRHGGKDLMAWSDAEHVHLPRSINRYDTSAANKELYFWLAAFFAADRLLKHESTLATGVRHLIHGMAISARVCAQYPGLASRYQRLCVKELEQRRSALPQLGSGTSRVHQLECAIRFALGSGVAPKDAWLQDAMSRATAGEVLAPPTEWSRSYTPVLAVPLWRRPAPEKPGIRFRWIKRRQRRSALGHKRPLNRTQYDPALKSQPDADASRRNETMYPEWSCHEARYIKNWCRVVERVPDATAKSGRALDSENSSVVQSIRRQFEAMRQVRSWTRQQDMGDEIDIDAYVDAVGERRANGDWSSGLYRTRTLYQRDVSIGLLLDTSRSMNAWINNQRVIEVARQAMATFSEALAILNDDFALFGFSSDSRIRVNCQRIKNFDENYDGIIRDRLQAIAPANYTRMGAAVRHVGRTLGQRTAAQKLLIVLTDGKPSDPTDQYDGIYALEDSRRALLESRAQGIHCFGITIDRLSHDYFARLFGPGNFSVVSDTLSLPRVLPQLYARITGV